MRRSVLPTSSCSVSKRSPTGCPGILDWLVSAKLLLPTPVLVYTLDGMPPGYAARLERGAALVGVGARAETADADGRLADLLVHLGSLAPRR